MDELKRYNNDGTEVSEIVKKLESHEPPKRRVSWLKLSALLIIFGAILLGAGWASGSRGGRVHFSGGFRVESFRRGQDEGSTAETFYNLSNIHTISVSASHGNVTVIPTSSPHIRVVPSNRTPLIISDSDGILHVTAPGAGENRHNWSRISFLSLGHSGVSINRYYIDNTRYGYVEFAVGRAGRNSSRDNIRIYVPDSVQNYIVATTTGTIRMDGVNATNVNLRATTGNINFNGQLLMGDIRTTTGTIRINTDENSTTILRAQSTTGNINFDGGIMYDSYFRATTGTIRATGEVKNTFSANATTGNIHVQDTTRLHDYVIAIDGIQLSATTGTIRFSSNAPEWNFRYNTQVTTGTIRTNGTRRETRNFSGGNGSFPMNVRTTTGNIHLEFGN